MPVALVTGAAQGIGANIATVFAENRTDVAIVDVKEEAAALAQRLAAQFGVRAIAIDADIAASAGCEHAITETVRALGRLDHVVNCAAPRRAKEGIGSFAASDWPLHEQVVLQAAVHLVHAAAPHLKASQGSVVNISSVVARAVGLAHCSWAYHVSKAGLEQLTRWMAVALGPDGVRVNAVAPGLIDRDGSTPSDAVKNVVDRTIPLKRGGTGRDVANAVVFLCSDAASYITGQVLTVDGGLGLHEVWSAAMLNDTAQK